VNPGQAIELNHLPTGPVEAQIQFLATEHPVTGCFSFADTPKLTRALRAGDEAAFAWLHEQWNNRLFRYCFALASADEAIAAEVSQSTYLRIFRHVRELPHEEALWNWMARAARSALIDQHRSRNRYAGALARFSDWVETLFGNREETASDEQASLMMALEEAIAQLDEPDRLLLELRYFQPTPLAEIAQRFNTTTRAIEGRLARTRSRLRKMIQSRATPGSQSSASSS
jgi:RNA polymerase sigma factor (sigma-70 family)